MPDCLIGCQQLVCCFVKSRKVEGGQFLYVVFFIYIKCLCAYHLYQGIDVLEKSLKVSPSTLVVVEPFLFNLCKKQTLHYYKSSHLHGTILFLFFWFSNVI